MVWYNDGKQYIKNTSDIEDSKLTVNMLFWMYHNKDEAIKQATENNQPYLDITNSEIESI